MSPCSRFGHTKSFQVAPAPGNDGLKGSGAIGREVLRNAGAGGTVYHDNSIASAG